MELFTVHLRREMRLSYAGIAAESPESAAAIARDKPTDEADNIEDCDGETLAALVDTAGDAKDRPSIPIDFEAQRQRRAAPVLLAALRSLLGDAENDAPGLRKLMDHPDTEEAAFQARRAIDAARTAIARVEDLHVPTDHLDVEALLASRRRIAIVWCIEDVCELRPDLDEKQAWEVLKVTQHDHDAAIGINWDVLTCHAELLFGPEPDRDDEEE